MVASVNPIVGYAGEAVAKDVRRKTFEGCVLEQFLPEFGKADERLLLFVPGNTNTYAARNVERPAGRELADRWVAPMRLLCCRSSEGSCSRRRAQSISI